MPNQVQPKKNKGYLPRALATNLALALSVSLLQVTPAVAEDAPPPAAIDLVARYVSESNVPQSLLDESTFREMTPTSIYRLDLQATCGHFSFIDSNGAGSADNQDVDFNSQPSHAKFFGDQAYLDGVLDNLRILRPEVPFFEGGTIPEDCPATSTVKAWVQDSADSWNANLIPSDQANYQLANSVEFPNVETPALETYNNGFKVSWPEYLGIQNYTPAGFTLRYREVTGGTQGPWTYVNVADNALSAVVELPVDPDTLMGDMGKSYEAYVAANVYDCNGNSHFGPYVSLFMVSQFGLNPDPAAGNVGAATTTGNNVASQCSGTPPSSELFEATADFTRFDWLGAGTGISNVVIRPQEGVQPPVLLGAESMRAYWIPNVDADPLTQGIEIKCKNVTGSNFGYDSHAAVLECPEFDLSDVQPGLTAQIKRYFANSDPWHQISIKLVSNVDGLAINGAIAYRIDLASGQGTELEMTSDGDLVLENSDTWFIASDSNDITKPASLHYFGDFGGTVTRDDLSTGAGKFWLKKPVMIDPLTNQTHRFVDGFTDLVTGTAGEAIIVAMKAADQLEYQQRQDEGWPGILNAELPDVINVSESGSVRTLPALRIQYECRDFGRNSIYPVVVQNDGKPIGCNIGNIDYGSTDTSSALDRGLYPSADEEQWKKSDWISTFTSAFPNATPRLGWACNDCIVTSVGPESQNTTLADGLPLGFTTEVAQASGLDRIRIFPQGVVQLHSSGSTDLLSGASVAAFGNVNLGNGSLQGPWNELPDYDFFYWGRTSYQGRLAFVITWVKIPTLDNGNLIDATPTTVQLMLVSGASPDSLNNYFSNPDQQPPTEVDVIWNFDSIQSQGAAPLFVTVNNDDPNDLYSGIATYSNGNTSLISDAFTTGDQTATVGLGNESCDSGCVSARLIGNKLQSTANGRYVLGIRTYETTQTLTGFPAPAAPRDVEFSRTVIETAIVSWSKPLPWVLRAFAGLTDDDTVPIYGYRIEYARNTRGEDFSCQNGGPDPAPCFSVFPAMDSPPLTMDSPGVTVSGGGDTERFSVSIPDLLKNEQYTFRVYATYAGLNLSQDPSYPSSEDFVFTNEVRSSPATANEFHEGNLQITTVGSEPNPLASGAQAIASTIAGTVTVTNATINGSPYAYGNTAESVGYFQGGENSIGFDQGIALTPLMDSRTFERGSGIAATDSRGQFPSYFANPNHRSKYFDLANSFAEVMSTQESWRLNNGFSPVCDVNSPPIDCINGATVLQFDVENPDVDSYLKFEYAIAGLEDASGQNAGYVYDYPDGFGLFVGGISQENSCALVPQVADETLSQRYMSMGNALNARLAMEVPIDSDLNSRTVSAIMSCVVDTSTIGSESITITMAIANARDGALSTGVFIKSNSIRFEPTAITLIDVPAANEGETYPELQFLSTGTVPASWSATGLPNGMSLSSSGLLTGVPTESGNFNFTVNALNQNEEVLASQAFTIQVSRSQNGNLVVHDRFLQGRYVEVGIGGNGHFGSSGDAPEGYHSRDTSMDDDDVQQRRIGFVSDRDRDGWGVGKDDGDFFVPGTPFEGFGIDVGGVSYFNDHNTTDIRRLSELTEVDAMIQKSTWTSEVMTNGLQVTQVASVPVNDQRLDVTVTLTNNSDVNLNDVYYARQVDNDANVYACQETGGGWKSLNTVVAQAGGNDGVSLVSSIMMDDCNDFETPTDLSEPHSYLGMISTDPSSVAALQGFDDFGSQRATDFVTGITETECALRGNGDGEEDEGPRCLPVMVTPGSQVFGDSGIGLGFNLGTFAPGASRTISFTYILSLEQAQEIIEDHNGQNGISAPAITAMRSNFVAAVSTSFSLSKSDWINSQAGGEVSYYTVTPTLPAGLSLNPSTGEISGTPTQTIGTSSFSLTAHNLAGSSTVDFLLAVVEGPYLYNDGGQLKASWPSVDPGGVPEYEYSLQRNGVSWSDATVVANDSSPLITVSPQVEFGSYKVRVRIAGAGDESWIESQPFFYGVTGCNSTSAELNVLMLSAEPGGELQGTNPTGIDANILEDICSSPWVNVEVFDGQGFTGEVKGSRDAWEEALEGVDVLVVPSLNFGSLRGSDLMSEGAFDLVDNWISRGGRLIFTGAAERVDELNYMARLESGDIDVVQTTEERGWRREETTNTSLPLNLQTYGQPGLNLWGIASNSYLDFYGETQSFMSASLASSFFVGYGSVVALSNNFETTDSNWRKVLTQSIHSTLKNGITVIENQSYWYLERGELYGGMSDSTPSSMVRLGSVSSQTTISCVNTPANPAIISRTHAGTTVKCGSMLVNDGIVETPVRARLTRFFVSGAPWVKTSVSITNEDPTNWYDNELWFGGRLGLGDEPLLEIEGRQITSGEDLESETQVLVASSGAAIGNAPEDGSGFMVVRVSGREPSRVYGGAALDGDPAFTRNQLWSVHRINNLEDEETFTYSWFEGFADYDPGCDRLASLNAWNRSGEFLLNSENEYSADGFESNNQLDLPNLFSLDCDLYGQQATDIEVRQNNGRVDLEWSKPIGATRYHIQYRIEGSTTWGNTNVVDSGRGDRDSYTVSGLQDGQTYEFRIRPLQENRTIAGDTGKGFWTITSPVTVSVDPTPSPTPSPTPTPSVSPTPVALKAQATPAVPKTIKNKKTIKFTMKTKAGLPLVVTASGKCKTSKILVKKKVGKKTVTTQTGWLVTANGVGNCSVKLSAKGNTVWKPLKVTKVVKVLK